MTADDGLGSDIPTVRRLLGEPDECPERADLETALARGRGAPEGNRNAAKAVTEAEPEAEETNSSNRTVCSPPARKPQRGTTVQYAVRRLASQRPDLLARVTAGELSCNAAMIEAGFRRVPTPLDLLRKAWAQASAEDRAALLAGLDAGELASLLGRGRVSE